MCRAQCQDHARTGIIDRVGGRPAATVDQRLARSCRRRAGRDQRRSRPRLGLAHRCRNRPSAPVTDQTYRGKWLLIYFGYTSCPDACPTALNNMGVALDRLGPEAAALQPIFITVDPKRDTREALAEYLTSFDPHIIALTGTEDQITPLLH